MNDKLQPQTVYVPVSVEDELPNENILVKVIHFADGVERVGDAILKEGKWIVNDDWDFNDLYGYDYNEKPIRFWLKETKDVYILTKEEFQKIVGDAVTKGSNIFIDVKNNSTLIEKEEEFEFRKEQYINSIT